MKPHDWQLSPARKWWEGVWAGTPWMLLHSLGPQVKLWLHFCTVGGGSDVLSISFTVHGGKTQEVKQNVFFLLRG